MMVAEILLTYLLNKSILMSRMSRKEESFSFVFCFFLIRLFFNATCLKLVELVSIIKQLSRLWCVKSHFFFHTE